MNKFLYLGSITENADYRRVCSILALFNPGDVIDTDEIATLAGLDFDTCNFMLDDLMERACLLPYPPGNPTEMRAAA